MHIRVSFHSYFKDLAECSSTDMELNNGATVADLLRALFERHPKLGAMRKSMLVAVGVEYATEDQMLRDGDEMALFPPVQGG